MRRTSRAPVLEAFAAAVAGILAMSPLQAQTVTKVRESGPRENRINIVFLSEGYTAQELETRFPADVLKLMDGLLGSQPFTEYRGYFNAFAISVASPESGTDHPARGIYRNTYFNSTFEAYANGNFLAIPPNDLNRNYADGQGKVDRLLMELVPDYDLAVVVVNDERYGGIARARTAVLSMSSFAKEVALHELGHTLADLADEYESAGTPDTIPGERPNATQQTQRSLIKWSSWIQSTTPIPTPSTFSESVIGLFEGANYNPSGWHRPKFNCRMRNAAVEFCEVCIEALTVNLNVRVSLADAPTPQRRELMLYAGEIQTFRIKRLQPATHNLTAQWYINNVPVAGATGDELSISASEMTPTQHQVRVEITDSTPFVRNDYLRALTRSEVWEVRINDTPPPTSAPVLNISTRVPVEAGEGVLIGGFIITGSAPKQVIVRGIGPSLSVGVGPVGGPTAASIEPLRDPVLELFDSAGARLALNDDWRDSQPQEIENTGIPPRHRLESAIVTTLVPGFYTAKLSGKGGTAGVGLVEVYDLQQNSTARVANISTRGSVKIGDDVMIGGFIIGSAGPGWTNVVVRAIGPSLAGAGIASPLADPTLELRNGQGELVLANDNWRDAQQEEISRSGIPPRDNREAAIYATLPAGAYTAIVAGKDSSTGVGLFELYNLGD